MSEWCHNHLEITGKSVCIDVMLQWINGTDVPRQRHAVQQGIQLFLAGAAGILKPVRQRRIRPVRVWSVQAQGFPLRLTEHPAQRRYQRSQTSRNHFVGDDHNAARANFGKPFPIAFKPQSERFFLCATGVLFIRQVAGQ